jgi:hypothetical protein
MSEQQQDGVGKVLRAHFDQDTARLPANMVDRVMARVQREQTRASRTKWVVLSVALAACIGLVVGLGPQSAWRQDRHALETPAPGAEVLASDPEHEDEVVVIAGRTSSRGKISEWDEDSLLQMTALNTLVVDDDDDDAQDDDDDDDDRSNPSNIHAEGSWESEAQ